jgi:site-specific recombinase XerD
MNEFFKTIRAFLTEYLPKQKCFSENTVRSYRQALNLLVTFLRAERSLSTDKITFEIFDKTLVVDFLGWLETTRNCSAASRNQRLMALRSFFAYAGNCDAMWMSLRLEVAAVPRKNEPGRIVGFLTEDALKALLGAPDPKKRVDLRNLTFMILMYDTAARCGELLSMKLGDLRLDTRHPVAYLHGKGNKTHTVPLLSRTVEHCKRYIKRFFDDERHNGDEYLFYTTIHGVAQPMSADNVALFLRKYATVARQFCPEVPHRIHPHMLRHTRAMHLYREGLPIMLLSEYLGHVNVETTKVYAYADTEMKRAALEKVNLGCGQDQDSTPVWLGDEDMILKLAGLR